jgi:hypothetical protein
MAFEEGKARRKSDGGFYKRRQAWVATRSGIVLAQSSRALVPIPDGRFRFGSDWSAPVYRSIQATEVPQRRIGNVSSDRQADHASLGLAEGGAESEAEQAVSYLPRAVRESVTARANPPTVFCAQALLYTRTDGSKYWTVAALKLNDADAVVVVGSHQEHLPDWQVEQVMYRFDTQVPSIQTRH